MSGNKDLGSYVAPSPSAQTARPNARPDTLTAEDRRILRIALRGPVHDSVALPNEKIAYMVRRGWVEKVLEYRDTNWRKWGLTRQYEITERARTALFADGALGRQDETADDATGARSATEGMPTDD